MDKYKVISMIAKARSEVLNYIETELESHGIEGLVVSHGNILNILYENNGRLTMKQIARGIDRSKSTLTQLIDKLIKEGYVKKQRSTEDRRYYYIILTEKGWSIKSYFEEISHRVINKFFKDFSQEDIDIFLKMLNKVICNFE